MEMTTSGKSYAIVRTSDLEEYRNYGTTQKSLHLRSIVAGTDDFSVENQVYSMRDIDPALDAKMRLVNRTIDEIGWTNMHLKLFILTGFGYCADVLIIVLQSIISGQAAKEFHPSFRRSLSFAAYAGLLIGSLFWGMTGGIIGRRFAFNTSLFICSIAAIIAGASPNWIFLATMVSIAAFGAAGNLTLDTSVLLESLPSEKQWLVTLMTCLGLSPLITGAFAWPFLSLPQFICTTAATCTYENNKGWRYIWFGCGGLVLVLSIARVLFVRLHETPKFLLCRGLDEEVVKYFKDLSAEYGRPCSLTAAELQACGSVVSTHGVSRWSFGEIWGHVRGLFATKKLGYSTALIWLSFLLIGLAYPLYYLFLPDYIAARGSVTGEDTPYEIWRDYFITNTVSLVGPVIAAFMCNSRLGRRYTMVVGALSTMAFFFGYTAIRTAAGNVAFSSILYVTINIYYCTLYAYATEVLPSAHRATGIGIAFTFNRIMGLTSAGIATAGNTDTNVPIFICGALYVVMAIVAVFLPFEAHGKKSM